MISLIAVLTINYVIGRENIIPWYFPPDRIWFRYHTLNKPVIMGRKTFESMNYKPLPDRLNIVLSNKLFQDQFKGVIIANNPMQALSLVKKYDEVMIIGGSTIYNIFLPKCTRMYLTYIHMQYNYGDSWFPIYNKKIWTLVKDIYELYVMDTNNTIRLNFKIFENYHI